MSEQQNCPIPVQLTSGSKDACSGENTSLQGGIEPICENRTSVRILEEFRHIYEERLKEIDEEMGGEGLELKLKTLTSWVNDLGEQNLMLVETVEQLEREAAGRVALLEERLKKSSHVALEYMSKLEEYDNQIWNLSEEKGVQMGFPFNASNGLMQAQQTEEILKTRVNNLQNDISCLLELIRRARYKGSWDTNGLNFLEVTYEDIFGPHAHQVPVPFEGSMLPKNNFGNPELDSASWKEKSPLETVEMDDLTKKLKDTNSHLQKTMKENECLVKEIEFLSTELKNKTDRIAALSQNTFEVDKNELEYRVTDLEATYLRLERSWDQAWEISKNGALDDLIYYQNALEERNTGKSKSCTLEIPEKMICTSGIKKDQERIRELCGEIKSLLQSTQQCSMKRGVSFASPSKEDYKLQVQELQKALKQAQNVAELARKKITKNIIGLKAIRSKCALVNNYYQEQRYSRKMKEMNVNILSHETLSSFLGNNYKRFDGGDLDIHLNLEKYFTDKSQSDLQISQYEMENVHKKLSVFTPQGCTHCNNLYKKNNDVFNFMEKLQMEIDTLKSTVSAKEKVILDQQEMLNIQQEALTMSQEEVKELQSQLKKLECYNEDESKQVQEQLVTISNLHQDLITTKHHLEKLQERSSFNISFENEEKRNKALQSRCQDFERKFQETREYWLFLLKQAQIMEQEMIKHDYQRTKVMKIIMPVIACIKTFCSKYLVEEGNSICNDLNSGVEGHGPFELVQLFSNNENGTVNDDKKTDHTSVVSLPFKNLEEEFENFNVQNSVCDKISKTELFKNFHLNELRRMLDAQALQRKITGKHKCNLPMSYSEAISYCNYMEHEINKLQDLLVDFQWLMSPIELDMKGQIDLGSTQTKVENLEMALNETSENYKRASLDCCKYQEQLLHAAEREVVLQEDFTEKERYWLETMYHTQAENLNYADALHSLNEEIELLQLELNERDCQLQNTASSLRGLSIESSFLQKELQKQELNVEKLEEQLLHNNIKLQQALSYLDEKNNLLLKLDKENQNIQDRLKNLEIKFQNCMSSEKDIFLQEISSLKTSVQQLKKRQERSNLEVREHWWWDDGWQIL